MKTPDTLAREINDLYEACGLDDHVDLDTEKHSLRSGSINEMPGAYPKIDTYYSSSSER